MSIRKVEFWCVSLMDTETDDGRVRCSVTGYQLLFERARDSVFIYRWFPNSTIGASVRLALDGFESVPFQFVHWEEGFERFYLIFHPTKLGYGWHKLLDFCSPSMFRSDVYFCFRRAFYKQIERTGVEGNVF